MVLLACFTAVFVGSLFALSRSAYGRWAAYVAAGSAAVFILLSATWIASDSFTGEGFNSAVLYHLRTGPEGAGLAEYLGMLVVTVVLAAVALLLGWALLRRLLPGARPDGSTSAAVLVLTLVALCAFHPTVNGLLSVFNASLYGPDAMLAGWLRAGDGKDAGGADFNDFYADPLIRGDSKRDLNLVVLYAESLEQTYFDEDLFPGLINELRKIEQEAVRFSDIRNLEGTGFTIAGMVASQCGLPLITNGHPNSMRGMDQFLPGATCIGDLLSERNYSLHYMGGASLSFAGKGKFFESHGFETVSGWQELAPLLEDPDYASNWGLYDDFLLEQFLDRYTTLSVADQPFGLFALTMDTHHPRGHQSRSCDGVVYGDGSNRMLNAVKCADILLANTVRAIRASEWSENTLLVVASDHTALKNDAWDILQQGRRRNLLWFFPPGEPARDIDRPGTTLDTAPAIMHFLGMPIAEFGLGRNLLEGGTSVAQSLPRMNWQMREWRREFASFWQLPNSFESLLIDPERMVVSIDNREFEAPALATFDGAELTSMRFAFDSITSLHSYVRESAGDTTLVWFDDCRNVRAMALTLPREGVCLFAGRPASGEAIAEALDEQWVLSATDLLQLGEGARLEKLWASRQANLEALDAHGAPGIREFDYQLDDLPVAQVLSVQSSGGPGSQSLVEQEGSRERLTRGLHLYAIAGDGKRELLKRFDPCGGEVDASIADTVRSYAPEALAYLLVVHDSASCGQPLDALFAGMPLTRWQDLGLRQPYVALLKGPDPSLNIEILGDAYTSLRVTFTPPAQIAGLPEPVFVGSD